MQNGNTFRAYTTGVVAALSELKVIEYYAEPIPVDLDGRLRVVVERFMAAPTPDREWFQHSLPESGRSLFGIYGHRAATIAARDEDAAWLLNGLVGYVIANFTIPEKRRVEVGLAVYHHVARKIKMNPIDLFEDAATYAGADMAARLLAFGRRGDVTLSRYGWQEVSTEAGVKYKFTY